MVKQIEEKPWRCDGLSEFIEEKRYNVQWVRNMDLVYKKYLHKKYYKIAPEIQESFLFDIANIGF